MRTQITEDAIEDFAINRLVDLGYTYYPGPALFQGADAGAVGGRRSKEDVVLLPELRAAVKRLNPQLAEDLREQAIQDLVNGMVPELIQANLETHKAFTEGSKVTVTEAGQERGKVVRFLDLDDPANNSFLVVNQLTIVENGKNKRPDVILFVNGLPLVVIELKRATDKKATIRSAYDQVQTYKAVLPTLFKYNVLCVVSDGLEARAGSLSAGYSRFSAWKGTAGGQEADPLIPEMETLINNQLRPDVLLEMLRYFTVFDDVEVKDKRTGLVQVRKVKKIAAYHQYYAVKAAVQSTLRAAGRTATGPTSTHNARRKGTQIDSTDNQTLGDHRAGVIWHTQGSGKSLSMVFFTGKIIQQLDNPTVVVITDRNDLDDQLFDTFFASRQLLRQEPIQANSTAELKTLLAREAGGVIFSTIQKFSPDEGNVFDELSNRENIVVITDEAHRSQYGLTAREKKVIDKETGVQIGSKTVYGYAKYLRDALPQATYLGFTGTPIERADANTIRVFGNYIDIYDIQQAVADGATVPMYYESRLAKVELSQEGRQLIADLDEEIGELNEHEQAKSRWTQIEAIIGNPARVQRVGLDAARHFTQRQEVFSGKGMIVAMSRRIAAALYEAIIAEYPEWHSDDLDKGAIKVVMTSASSDGAEVARHHTTKSDRKFLAARMRDPNDPLKLVIVRDMWLTGFDAPSLHTLYIDKPMKGHNLMQAIARVNRVWKDKPAGLIVDYLGIASDLKEALSFYTQSGGQGDPAAEQEEAVQIFLEKLDVIQGMFYRLDYRPYFTADTQTKLRMILQGEDYVLGLPRGKDRFLHEMRLLNKSFAISVPHPEALDQRDEVSYFQAIQTRLAKFDVTGSGRSDVEMETTIRQVVDQALTSGEVIDIYDAAGLQKRDISILAEDFLLEVKNLEHKNVALELLKKMLNDEIKTRAQRNIVQGRSLMELLEAALVRYHNKSITAVEAIEEMIDLARYVRNQDKTYQELGLTEYEYAFYTALADNESAREVMQQERLRELAVELFNRVKKNTTLDWQIKEDVRAKLRVVVKRTLRQFGYPPDMQKLATDLVLRQVEGLVLEMG
ncbi:type I restriction endonuclease subunit R [Lewinella sp. 4G2]|uniref:type I restriction endonuclease subunit R n=1 Tax=Lewinella sp. 4G2 TaxID=1803372 RepID=UPI0007B49392|nr:type I restriction endonuclease subunit R [Lewinella sp. 4G2]OAV43960.1 DEAD/DEAH box helicase [Lewinella sp. 4G2]